MRKRIISILLAALSATCILLVGTIIAVAAPDPSDDQIVEATITYDAEKKIYKVLGNGKNNVLNWATFDIDEKETVEFIDDRNYLNIVNDDTMSRIDGKIVGKGNIYIVNPNGVLFSDNSIVDCGYLFVSARPIVAIGTEAFRDGQDLFAKAPEGRIGDVIDLGTIKADRVYIEGDDVFLSGSAVGEIPSNKLTVISNDNQDALGLGSVLSDGYPWTVITVVSAVVFGLGGFLLGRKKKPAADGAEKKDGE